MTPDGPDGGDPGRVVPGRAERNSGPVYPGRASRNANSGRITGRLTRSKPGRGAPPAGGPREAPPPRGAPTGGGPAEQDPAAPVWDVAARAGPDRADPPIAGRASRNGAGRAEAPVTPGRASRNGARRSARTRPGGAVRAGAGAGAPGRGRTGPGPRKAGRTGLLLAAVLVVAAGALVGVTRALPAAKTPPAPATGAPYAGRWVCPTLPGLAGAVTVTNVGSAEAGIRTLSAGQSASAARLGPGATRTIDLKPGAGAGFLQVEAFGAPIAVAAGEQPPCAPGPGERWWLPGLVSSTTARTDVVLANPDSVDATVAITPHLTEGSIHPASLQNVFVRARTAVIKTLDVPDVQTLPFTAEVVATSGRVVTGALVTSKAGKQARQTLVPGQPALRSSWVFSGGLTQDASDVDVLIANPNQSTLNVVVDATTAQGTFRASGFDLPIPDGAATAPARVPLNLDSSKTGAFPFSLRIRSRDGSKFAAVLRYDLPDGKIAGYYDLGGSPDDARWLLPQAPASHKLVFSNVSGQPVSAQLSSLAGPAPGSGGAAAGTVTVAAGKVSLQAIPAGARSLLVVASQPGLVAAPLGGGQVVPGSQVGGLAVGGPVLPGPAAAP
jgi:hypothetical protein